MPFYVFSCPLCGVREEDFSYKADGGKSLPPRACCGWGSLGVDHPTALMERDLMAEARPHIPSSIWPLVTKNIDGTPRAFSSQRELDSALKREGLTQRDDAAWEEDEITWGTVGMRERRVIFDGKEIVLPPRPIPGQVIKRGSGMGNPRSWSAIPSLLSLPQEEINRFLDRKEEKK